LSVPGWAGRIELIALDSQRKPTPPRKDSDEPSASERRRIGEVVHDDRGNARVEWRDAPADYDRPRLEIEDPGTTQRRLAVLNDGRGGEPTNPYNRSADPKRNASPPPQKRDLRKLSAWIKLMREMEDRKARGEPEDPSDA
jgi:hypothetical protein